MPHNPDVFLDRWRGGEAKLWEYSVSHRSLIIRIERVGRKGNLHIRCADVSFISGPTAWVSSSFEIEATEAEYLVRDRAVEFEVRAGFVDVAENCKPIY